MGRKRGGSDHRADLKGGALSGFPHCVADSQAFLALDPFDRAVLAEILRRFNGYNNGQIVISYSEIGERLTGSNKSAPNNGRIGRAIAKLMQHGLIAEPTAASWLQRKAREYRLTFISSGNGPPYRPATNDYLKWKPEEKKHGDAPSPDAPQTGDQESPGRILAGDAQSPAIARNGSFALSTNRVPGDAGSLLIDSHTSPRLSGRREQPVSTPYLPNGSGLAGEAA